MIKPITGYDAAIKETARYTGERIELDESAIELLEMKLHMLIDNISDLREITVTYFQPDEKKEGGSYVSTTDSLKKFDDYERMIILTNGQKILIEDIFDIECELFKDLI